MTLPIARLLTLTLTLALACGCNQPQPTFSALAVDDHLEPAPQLPYDPPELREQALSGNVPDECWRRVSPWELPALGGRIVVGGEPGPVPTSQRIPDLRCWLDHNPDVAESLVWETQYYGGQSFAKWDVALQDNLVARFEAMWWWLQAGRTGKKPFGIMDPPPNKLADKLADSDGALTVLWDGDAWNLYCTQVATSLVVELSALVPWSLTALDPTMRAEILDSRRFFLWDDQNKGYALSFSVGFSLPASPDTTIDFLLSNQLVAATRRDTIGAFLSWERQNLQHLYNIKGLAGEMEAAYGYRGFPPAATVLSGSDHAPDGFAHWIMGCYGNTGFLRSMLRVLNIPVERLFAAGHTMPRFHGMGSWYLSHGDDPYGANFWSLPPGPGAELLLSETTWNKWFVNPINPDPLNNVGRTTALIALERPSLYQARAYCADKLSGADHQSGKVLASFDGRFSLAEVEAAGLWPLLDGLLVTAGGCAKLNSYAKTFYP